LSNREISGSSKKVDRGEAKEELRAHESDYTQAKHTKKPEYV
jgi:hypothetical protein